MNLKTLLPKHKMHHKHHKGHADAAQDKAMIKKEVMPHVKELIAHHRAMEMHHKKAHKKLSGMC